MTRLVLVGWANHDWRIYRQQQWMAEVRRHPEATQFPRRHFDIEDSAFNVVQGLWSLDEAKTSEPAATALLASHGAIEVLRH